MMRVQIVRGCLMVGCVLVAMMGAVARGETKGAGESAERGERMGWWREAKFGMFIHWGLYSVPGGEWKGQKVPGIGEWIMFKSRIPVDEYAQLATQFNPVKFDAEAWAQLAQDAGMTYLVITSKHHDGFAMFGTKVSPFNIVDATPFKRDPVKELAAACAKRGIKFGCYYSQAQDWHAPGGAIWLGRHEDGPDYHGKRWDPKQEGDFETYFNTVAIPQVREILSNYGPIALIWFDTPLKSMTAERAGRMEKMVHELQPKCLVSGRLGEGSHSDYASEGDNRIPSAGRAGDWETPATLNDTWGFKKDDQNWKRPEDLTFKLVDIVSKGGNYLLNVGPDGLGEIPQPSQEMLRAVGKWVKVNGEAIYGAGPTPFGAEFGKATGKKDARNRPIIAETKDWRCTSKPGKLYFSVFKWPTDGKFVTPAMKGNVKGAYLLADAERKGLEISKAEAGVVVSVPAESPTAVAGVIVVEVE